MDFPNYLFLSKNWFKTGWALNAHRRLKNLVIVMDWTPDASAAKAFDVSTFGDTSDGTFSPGFEEGTTGLRNDADEPGGGGGVLAQASVLAQTMTATLVNSTTTRKQKSWTPTELTKEQELSLHAAFAMFDEKKLGRLDEVQLREVLRSADACVGGDEGALTVLARRVMGGDAEEGISLKSLKVSLAKENIYGVQDGRFYVAVSLAEAESLRAAMRAAKREAFESNGACDGRLVPFHDVELGLRVLSPGGDGALLESSSGYVPAELFQASTATQCFRFLDSQMDFEAHEVSLLLRALQGSAPETRVEFFEKVKAVRRRPKGIDWRDTPLARALTTADAFALLASRASSSRVRQALRQRKMRLLDAFRAFDGETQNGRLSYEALYGGLTWLGVELTPVQMMDLARKIDTAQTGFVTYSQFVEAFGPDEAWAAGDGDDDDGTRNTSGENADGTDSKTRRPSALDAFYGDSGDAGDFGDMMSASTRDDSDLFGLNKKSAARYVLHFPNPITVYCPSLTVLLEQVH